jgi:PAS domain S-box-containing protein
VSIACAAAEIDRYRVITDAAPVMIWQTDLHKRAVYFNRAWLEFTGRTEAQEADDGWADGVHPEDLERCLRGFATAFDQRQSFEMEYRLLRHDCEYRWILDRGTPLFATDGSFNGYIGGCIDITERKKTEVEKHLEIVALQDHALQTFFVIGLVARAALAELAPDRVSEPVAAALVQLVDLASAGTEHLREAIFALNHGEVAARGVVPALWRLVRSFQQRTGIEADLIVTGAQRQLPTEIAEMLHMVGREALANVERHPQAGAVVLGLHIARHSVTLSIQDDGAGTSAPALKRIADSATHFGLRGVGQRVRRLGGTFVAQPARDGGFLVRTRLPLKGDVQP